MSKKYQKYYWKALKKIHGNELPKKVFLEMMMRASYANSNEVITGNGIIHVVNTLLRKRKKMPERDFIHLVQGFLDRYRVEKKPSLQKLSKYSKQVLDEIISIVDYNKYSI